MTADHVAVSYDSNRMRSFSSRPYEPSERAGFFAVLAEMREELTRNGLTVVEKVRNDEMVWVQRPPASTRARIVLADDSGFAWLPEMADEYQQETRWSLEEPWAPQLRYGRDGVLRGLEFVLRRGIATAEAEGRTIYVAGAPSDFAPYSRFVPTAGSIEEAMAVTMFPLPSDVRTPKERGAEAERLLGAGQEFTETYVNEVGERSRDAYDRDVAVLVVMRALALVYDVQPVDGGVRIRRPDGGVITLKAKTQSVKA